MHTDIHALSEIRTPLPVLEWVKLVHALDHAATVIGKAILWKREITKQQNTTFI
jgi:hypothetical protein